MKFFRSGVRKKTGRRKTPAAPPALSDRPRRWRAWLFFLCGLAAAVAGVLGFLFRAPVFTVRSIQVADNRDYSAGEIIGISALAPGENIFLIGLREARRRLLAENNIRDAFIHRVYPDIVHIRIFEREPRARLRYGRGDVLEETVDEHGVVLGGKKKRPGDILPVVYGLAAEGGEVAPPAGRLDMESFFAALDSSGIEAMFRVESIRLGDPHKLVLTANRGMEVTMSRGNYPAQFERLRTLLSRISSGGGKSPVSVDLRPQARVPVRFGP